MARTVQVRVAVVVDRDGKWNAAGYPKEDGSQRPDEEAFMDILDFIEPGERRYILTAELEMPESREPIEVKASVHDGSQAAVDQGDGA